MEKDIVSAIGAEQMYIYEKTHSENRNVSIYDYISKYGYTDLQEYTRDKVLYTLYLQGIEAVEISPEYVNTNGSNVAFDYIGKGKPCLLWSIHHDNVVFLPLSNGRHYDGFIEIRPGYDCEQGKGQILSFDGDLDIVLIVPVECRQFHSILIGNIREYFSEMEGGNIDVNNNDIMCGGDKLSGTATFGKDGYNVYLTHFTFTDHCDEIVGILGESAKRPGRIDFTTPEELIGRIERWLP